MPRQSGAQFLADSLHAYGVTHVFFVPAILSHTLAELDKRTPIKRILTHGEKAAVYMADGYARASGRVGVSFAQCIGAANLAAGLRDPFLACSPLVVFTGGPDAQSRSRHVYQEIEDFPLFKPVTKFSARVDAVRRLPDTLRQAFRAATTLTPGPAHLELAGHMGELEQETADLELIAEPAFGRVPALRIAPDLQAVRAAAQLLCAAERPIIVAGGALAPQTPAPFCESWPSGLPFPSPRRSMARTCSPATIHSLWGSWALIHAQAPIEASWPRISSSSSAVKPAARSALAGGCRSPAHRSFNWISILRSSDAIIPIASRSGATPSLVSRA